VETAGQLNQKVTNSLLEAVIHLLQENLVK
jgi:hypothetical protein